MKRYIVEISRWTPCKEDGSGGQREYRYLWLDDEGQAWERGQCEFFIDWNGGIAYKNNGRGALQNISNPIEDLLIYFNGDRERAEKLNLQIQEAYDRWCREPEWMQSYRTISGNQRYSPPKPVPLEEFWAFAERAKAMAEGAINLLGPEVITTIGEYDLHDGFGGMERIPATAWVVCRHFDGADILMEREAFPLLGFSVQISPELLEAGALWPDADEPIILPFRRAA